MRKTIPLAALVMMSACQKPVAVPSVEEFKKNSALLSDWTDKCRHGEYSHLAASEQANMCGNAEQAGLELSGEAASRAIANTADQLILRK